MKQSLIERFFWSDSTSTSAFSQLTSEHIQCLLGGFTYFPPMRTYFFAKRLTVLGKYWFSPWLQWCSLCTLWVEWSSPSKHFLNQNSRPIFLIHFKINVVVFFCSFLEILDCLLDQFDPLAFFCFIFLLLPDMCKWRELLFWFVPVFGVARPQSALVGRPHHVVYGRRAVCRKQRFPAGGAPMASAWHRIILETTESFASQFWSVVWRGVHSLF